MNMFFSFFSSGLRLICLLVFFGGICSSCTSDTAFDLLTASQTSSYYGVGKQLSELLQKDIQLEVRSSPELSSYINTKMLLEDKADFALAQNDVGLLGESLDNSAIRTVMPLYPEPLFILYPDSIEASDLPSLVEGRKVYVGGMESGTARFMRQVFKHFGVSVGTFDYVYTEDAPLLPSAEVPILCLLTGYNNPQLKAWLAQPNMRIFSLDSPQSRGSKAEGFAMNYNLARPFVIPSALFGTKPTAPVLTLAVDAVLLTRATMDEDLIYQMTEEIYTHRQLLSNKEPMLGAIEEEFNQKHFSFPLHEGARRYFERNEPSIFERYAELFGVVFSLILTAFGAASTFLKWRERQKKDRIDVFYSDILKVEESLAKITTLQDHQKALSEVSAIKQEAFRLLIRERLLANESFAIFMQLVDSLILRLERRIHAQQNH